ncbi:P-loop containing nucleoside triphosphate hydrolase protein, partial [Colletotrichum sublineola]
ETSKLPPLTDEQALLASPKLCGFSFTEKKFLHFFVDRTSPIQWNARCFEHLVLPDSQKELVQALVAEHASRGGDGGGTLAFDDIVQGKGRGLVLVLHGPPGVGKTLTAECVAEFSRRPLYIVSSGDLGTSVSELDEKLGRTLDLASMWKAVLLIDEADVFLERRSLNNMERNGLVSIFLRALEYYIGILFMATNRVCTFDDAFKSRIHVPLWYDELSPASRARVWRNFLKGVEGSADVDEAGYDALAEAPLNGRQIKKVVRTAKSLAMYKRRRLDLGQLQQVVDIQLKFERELA